MEAQRTEVQKSPSSLFRVLPMKAGWALGQGGSLGAAPERWPGTIRVVRRDFVIDNKHLVL